MDCKRVFEGNLADIASLLAAGAAEIAQNFFMAIELVAEFCKGILYRGGSLWIGGAGGHLPRGKAQVECNYDSFRACAMIDDALEMNQAGAEDLQAALQFFYLGLDFVFNGMVFCGFEAD